MSDGNRDRVATSLSTSRAGLFHLGVVYVVWGSTYLAMRVAVEPGGFAPFSMGALRVLTASVILLLWSRWRKHRLRLSRSEQLTLALSGALLWVGGNGLALWAEQRVSSGYAALFMASMPMWVVFIEATLDRRPPSRMLVLALATGFVGVGILAAPLLIHRGPAGLWRLVALMVAPISWSAGSLLQSRRPVAVEPIVSSAYQQLSGGVVFAIVSVLAGDAWGHPSTRAWAAFGYLLVFGSLLAYTSFVLALRLLPSSLVMTYAYVNPVIAVLLGWLLLGETVTGWTLGGSALVLLGVAGVFQHRRREMMIRTQGAVKEPSTAG